MLKGKPMAHGPEIIGGNTPDSGKSHFDDLKKEIGALRNEVRAEADALDSVEGGEAVRFADAPGATAGTIELTDAGRDTANTVYILYLVNLVVPFCGIVGLIMAYNAMPNATPDVQTHLRNQIRLFWTSVIGYLISFVLLFILIGFLTFMLVWVWRLVRTVTGFSLLGAGKPVRNVESLNFVSE